jgi:hypothetical protein
MLITDEYHKAMLKAYGYEPSTFRLIEAETHADRGTDIGYECEGKQLYLVPASIEKDVDHVTVNFTLTAINFKDRHDHVLLSTVGRGYDDLVTPTAICIEPAEECVEC